MNPSVLAKELSGLVGKTLSKNGAEIERAGRACRAALAAGGQVLAFGNGGSAAEAQHFVAELVNKFGAPRPALRAVSLTTDTSILTSIANDMSFAAVFSRQIEALGRAGDVALALSTSGASPNVVRGLATARKRGMITIGLTGGGRGEDGAAVRFPAPRAVEEHAPRPGDAPRAPPPPRRRDRTRRAPGLPIAHKGTQRVPPRKARAPFLMFAYGQSLRPATFFGILGACLPEIS